MWDKENTLDEQRFLIIWAYGPFSTRPIFVLIGLSCENLKYISPSLFICSRPFVFCHKFSVQDNNFFMHDSSFFFFFLIFFVKVCCKNYNLEATQRVTKYETENIQKKIHVPFYYCLELKSLGSKLIFCMHHKLS